MLSQWARGRSHRSQSSTNQCAPSKLIVGVALATQHAARNCLPVRLGCGQLAAPRRGIDHVPCDHVQASCLPCSLTLHTAKKVPSTAPSTDNPVYSDSPSGRAETSRAAGVRRRLTSCAWICACKTMALGLPRSDAVKMLSSLIEKASPFARDFLRLQAVRFGPSVGLPIVRGAAHLNLDKDDVDAIGVAPREDVTIRLPYRVELIGNPQLPCM